MPSQYIRQQQLWHRRYDFEESDDPIITSTTATLYQDEVGYYYEFRDRYGRTRRCPTDEHGTSVGGTYYLTEADAVEGHIEKLKLDTLELESAIEHWQTRLAHLIKQRNV